MTAFPQLDATSPAHALSARDDMGAWSGSLGSVAVFGLGVSGMPVARWAIAQLGGRVERVALVDGQDSQELRTNIEELAGDSGRVDAYLGDDAERLPGGYGIGVISPGIAPGTPLWDLAFRSCAEVISEVELAYRESSHRWIAITGTNGKTTTTSLVTHLLNSAQVPAVSVGNIGYPALQAALTVSSATVLVAEVSSFQLATSHSFHPEAAAVVNITPDHLNWHGTMDRYIADKLRVFANLQHEDLALVFGDDEVTLDASERALAGRTSPWVITLSGPASQTALTCWGDPQDPILGIGGVDGEDEPWCRASELNIKGAHNWANALFAGGIARYWGLTPSQVAEGLRSFEPVEHRLQFVASVAGSDYYNDSKATNPDATMKAVDSFPGRVVHLLVGGRPKGSDFHELAEYAQHKAATVTCFGEAGDELHEAFTDVWSVASHGSVFREPTMASALAAAADRAQEGDVVLLSPACASFDEFSGYEERGRVFADLVQAMIGGGESGVG